MAGALDIYLNPPKESEHSLLVVYMQTVKKIYRVGYLRQLIEIYLLGKGPGKLKPAEYFRYGLFRKTFRLSQKKKFLSPLKYHGLSKRLSHSGKQHFELIQNKIAFETFLKSMSIPSTRTIATCGVGENIDDRSFDILLNKQELSQFLYSVKRFPLFVKPNKGGRGIASFAIYGREDNNLILQNGASVEIDEFSDVIFKRYGKNFLLQLMEAQHNNLIKHFSSIPAVFRIVTQSTPGKGIETLFLYGKFPEANSRGVVHTESKFHYATLDPVTGALTSDFFRNAPLYSEANINSVFDRKALSEFRLPYCRELVEIAHRVHQNLSGLVWLGLDLIVTQNGPIVLEGDHLLHARFIQLATGKGLLEGEVGEKIDPVIRELDIAA